MRASCFILIFSLGLIAVADDPSDTKVDAKSVELFEKRIRPLLVERCFACHGEDQAESELRLDSRADMLEGGSRGAAIIPGDPDKSLLIRAVNHADTLAMPPKEKLAQRDINDLIAWVKNGAVWTDSDKPKTATKKSVVKSETKPMQFTEEQKNFWSFQPMKNPRPPRSPTLRVGPNGSKALDSESRATWLQSPIDCFILTELESRSLKPAEIADKRTLIRRATFDLIGIPPTPEEVAEFLADNEPDAFTRVIDRLLASPRYGERWGRHWLDVARYGDSNGLDENLAQANAFRYRDWVISAFNRDLPFDEFVREQIAGDLLPPDGDPNDPVVAAKQSERLTATGFLVIAAKMLAEDDPLKMQMDIVDEQVDTIGKAFMGLTLGCARCHDHKFDPLPMADYYSLAGIFKSTKAMENYSVVARWQERPLASPVVTQQLAEQKQRIAGKQAEINQLIAKANEQLLDESRNRVADYVRAAAREIYLEKSSHSFGAEFDKRTDKSAPPPDGVQVIEAENYQRGNALKLTTGYGEGIGVILSNGNGEWTAEYDVTVPTAGLYQIEVRYAAADSRPTQLSLNGHIVKPNGLNEVTGSWNPDTNRWHVEGSYEFKAGVNAIRLFRKPPLPHIDKLLIAPVTLATGGSPVVVAVTDLRPAFVAQWKRHLEKSVEDPNTPFADWRGLLMSIERTKGTERTKATESLQQLLLLADKTGEELSDVVTAWKQLKATEAGKATTELPNARQETLRKLVFNTTEGAPFAVPKNAEEYFAAEAKTALQSRRDEVKQLEAALPKLPEAMAVSEGVVEDLPIHLRGNHTTLGKERLPRRFPRVVAGDQQTPIAADRSGRLEFARWLTEPNHPLTARVAVNRIWQGHFGEGLVRSPDNFGLLGDKPTHPALLDWLAQEFMGLSARRGSPDPAEGSTAGLPERSLNADQGRPTVTTSGGVGRPAPSARDWSLKRLHRAIMLSSAYQMQTTFNDAAFLTDPDNRLWWRRNRRRLEVEAVRDSLLAVSGRLDNSMGGSLLPSPNRAYVTGTANNYPKIYDTNRRSVYLPVIRSALYELYQVFDFAEPSVLNGKRDTTTLATQALFMINSQLVGDQAGDIASRVLAADGDDADRVRRVFQITLQREPTSSEVSRALDFVQGFDAAAETGGTPAERRLAAWKGFCRALLASSEFLFVE